MINACLLFLFFNILNIPIFVSQLVASEIALFNNFLWHHNWTYKQNRVSKGLGRLLMEFHATSWVAILGSSLLVAFGVDFLGLNYLIALIISSAIALLWNFTWTKFFIWHKDKTKEQDTTI